ncbi:MAG TPA: hypothetical protein VF416_08600 [Marmoricola sp.]
MSAQTRPPGAADTAGPPESRPDVITLAEIVDHSPRWAGPDRQTFRQGYVAGLGGLAVAVFLGGTTGLVLYLVLVKVLAHLS